jgi:Skp family chaperone for outer membrane proteins
MFKKSPLAILLFIFIALTGCDQLSSSSKSLVLDLDAIANATGQANIIKQQIEKANNELNSQLSSISNQLNEQLASEKKKLGKKPSKKDQQKLQQLTLQANQKMQQAKMLASQKSQQYKAALVQQLLKNVKPIAENIARQRNANLVSLSNNATIWFNPEIDITDEIIAQMRAQPAASIETQPAEPQQSEDKDKS